MLAELKLTQVTGFICSGAGDLNPVLDEFKVLVFPLNCMLILLAKLNTYLEVVLKHVCFSRLPLKRNLKIAISQVPVLFPRCVELFPLAGISN